MEHDRWQSHFLAASTEYWTVTHPSIDQAHGCLTSVIRPQMVAPFQWGWSNFECASEVSLFDLAGFWWILTAAFGVVLFEDFWPLGGKDSPHFFETDVLEVTNLSLTTFGVVFFEDFWPLGCKDLPPLHVFETNVLEVTHLSLTTFGVVFFEYSGVLGCKDLPCFFETDVLEVTHFA